MKYCVFSSFVFAIIFSTALAQSNVGPKSDSVPKAELFVPVLDMLTVDGTKNGRGIYGDTVKLFNNDGSLWLEYSLLESHPLYYRKLTLGSIEPIFGDNYSFFRLVAVSENWYEVEINSATEDTKFVKIADPFIKRDEITLRIRLSPFIKFDEINNPLLDNPGGKQSSCESSDQSIFKAIGGPEGDWLQVQAHRIDTRPDEFGCTGWIRWKRNNDLLISFGYR